MVYSGTYIQFSLSANTSTVYYHPSLHDLWVACEVFEREEKARRMFAWKEPKKRIPVSTVQVIRKYEKRFIGRKFPVGGPKK